MSDIVYATSTVEVVRTLDIVSAHVCGFCADCIIVKQTALQRLIGGSAIVNLVTTSIRHVVCKFSIIIHSIVVCLDSVCIVDSEPRPELDLNGLRRI